MLRRAIELAIGNASAGQLPFGALVVRDSEIIGTGVNTELRDQDPTAHAEVAAIRDACAQLGTRRLAGAVVVSSCEPCAICQTVCAAVGIAEVVYAAAKESVPDLGGPPPPDDLMPLMQDALRALAPDRFRHVPLAGSEEPFERFLA